MGLTWWYIFFGIMAVIMAFVLERIGQKAKRANLRRAQRLFRDSIGMSMVAILAFVLAIIMALIGR